MRLKSGSAGVGMPGLNSSFTVAVDPRINTPAKACWSLQVRDLINFRGTLFYPWPQVFRPLGQGGHVGFGAAQRRRSEAI